MEISFIHAQSLIHLHVNKTNFNMKSFALGLALKLRRQATRKSRQFHHYISQNISTRKLEFEALRLWENSALRDVEFVKHHTTQCN